MTLNLTNGMFLRSAQSGALAAGHPLPVERDTPWRRCASHGGCPLPANPTLRIRRTSDCSDAPESPALPIPDRCVHPGKST